MIARLRAQPQRADLLAAGGVLLAVAIVLLSERMGRTWGKGIILLVNAVPAGLLLAMGLGTEPGWREGADRRPRAAVGVLLLAGFVLAVIATGELARVLGARSAFGSAGSTFWVSAVLAAGALVLWRLRAVAFLVLVACIFGGLSLLAFARFAAHASGLGTYRALLVFLVFVFAGAHLATREGPRRRESVLLVDAAGLAALTLALTLVTRVLGAALSTFGSTSAAGALGGAGTGGSTGWELVVLVLGCGLVAFAAIEREPGPGILGFLTLTLFAVLAGIPSSLNPSLVGWPLALLVLAVVVIGAALRPSRPLPPEPGGLGGPGGTTVPLERPPEPPA